MWDSAEGTLVARLAGLHETAALSVSDTHVAAVDTRGRMGVWELPSGQCIKRPKSFGKGVHSLSFNGASSALLVAKYDALYRLQAPDWEKCTVHSDTPFRLTSPPQPLSDGWAVAGTPSITGRLTTEGRVSVVCPFRAEFWRSLSTVQENKRRLWVTSDRVQIACWDEDGGVVAALVSEGSNPPEKVLFLDGQHVALLSSGTKHRIWNVENGQVAQFSTPELLGEDVPQLSLERDALLLPRGQGILRIPLPTELDYQTPSVSASAAPVHDNPKFDRAPPGGFEPVQHGPLSLDSLQEVAWQDWRLANRVLIEGVPVDFEKSTWEWGQTSWGVHGVHLFTGKLVWHSSPFNRHAGGGAGSQSFKSFLSIGQSAGPSMPDALLAELYVVLLRRTRVGSG